MNKSEIVDILGTKISENIIKQPGRIISDVEKLISSGIIDSFSLVDLAIMVEENFGVRIEDFELNSDTFDDLNQLADIILSRM